MDRKRVFGRNNDVSYACTKDSQIIRNKFPNIWLYPYFERITKRLKFVRITVNNVFTQKLIKRCLNSFAWIDGCDALKTKR